MPHDGNVPGYSVSLRAVAGGSVIPCHGLIVRDAEKYSISHPHQRGHSDHVERVNYSDDCLETDAHQIGAHIYVEELLETFAQADRKR